MDEPRIAPVDDLSALEDREREFLGGLSTDGRVLNIFRTLIRHPQLLRTWIAFARHILRETSLPKRDREMLILRTAHRCDSTYEWGQHARIALRAGLTEEEVQRVADGPDAEGWTEADAVILRATDELLDEHVLSDETWRQLSSRYDTHQVMDAIFTVGNYAMLAGALNSFGVPLDDDGPVR